MQEAENVKTVQGMYAAFSRRDVQALVNAVDEQVVWRPVIGAAPDVATGGERRGRAAVAEFFRVLDEALVFTEFTPREFIAQNDQVVVVGTYTGHPKATGRSFRSEWTMIFTLKNGKVVQFREFTDTAAINAAWAGAHGRA